MQVAELSLQDWDDFVCVTPQSSAYAKSTFLGTMPCKLNLLHFDFGGGQQLGAIISNPDQVDSCSPYPYTCYQGLFRFPTSQNYIRDTNQLAEALEFIENKFSRLCFSLHPSFNDIRAIQWSLGVAGEHVACGVFCDESVARHCFCSLLKCGAFYSVTHVLHCCAC